MNNAKLKLNGKVTWPLVFYALITFVTGMVGGGSGTYLWVSQITPRQLQTIARPDPFTGTQAREIIDSVRSLDNRLRDLERDILLRVTRIEQQHVDYGRRLDRLEEQE